MKNPLRKRLLRELRDERGKYLVIFLLLTLTIGFVSGFLVADGSMIQAYDESFETYNIEDGHFLLREPMNTGRAKKVSQLGIDVYELFYQEESLDNQTTLRIYQDREQINKVCIMAGEAPKHTGEIAIDRMYADNNSISIGDTLQSEQHSWKVCGLVALSDYSALFSNNSDTMFDSKNFGVAVVSKEEFQTYKKKDLRACYGWKYQDGIPEDEAQENKKAEDLLKKLASAVSLQEYIPRYQNQAIQFTGDDMGSDRGMMLILLYIMTAIMAFVFGITTENTIARESNVIGTLRASGCTKKELIIHYLTPPMLVSAAAAIVGNMLGYTAFRGVCAGMYYGSYSLPTYVTRWNAEALILTTIIPLLLMAGINFVILADKLMLPPLKFLRRDLKRKKQRRAFPLNKHIPFFLRFRLRVVFQNMGNYIMLFVGILFANLLLLFGLGLPDCLNSYQANIENNLLAKYQYILKMPLDAAGDDFTLANMAKLFTFQLDVETANSSAEKMTAYSLKTIAEESYKSEDIAIYGVRPHSKYIPIEAKDDHVWISSAMAEKYQYQVGDRITLKETYKNTTYTFVIDGIYDYLGGLTVFMDQDSMNALLDLGEGYFSGYLSDERITDIRDEYIDSVIDIQDLTKVSRQLDISMGQMMYLVDGFAVSIFMVLIYLLSKLIIEKNTQAISMTKILGYFNPEINRLYIMPTTILFAIFFLLSIPIDYYSVCKLMRWMMLTEMSGWIPMNLSIWTYVKMCILGALTYAAAAWLEMRRVRRIAMDEALKNIE